MLFEKEMNKPKVKVKAKGYKSRKKNIEYINQEKKYKVFIFYFTCIYILFPHRLWRVAYVKNHKRWLSDGNAHSSICYY